MARKWMMATALVLAMSAGSGQAAVPGNIAAALSDKARPAEEVARDASRKPGEVLALGEVKTGGKVVDLVMGGGYFTRILSAAVGPKGQFIQFQASYGENQKKVAEAYANVTPLTATFGAMDLPDGMDLVLTVQNYHDLHLKPFPADTAKKVNAEIFKSLKPGGIYLVIDHTALAGSGLEAADKIHRIDPAIVRQEVEAAGFKLESESAMLAETTDPKTGNVFAPAIRGKTDQFIMKFRKPK